MWLSPQYRSEKEADPRWRSLGSTSQGWSRWPETSTVDKIGFSFWILDLSRVLHQHLRFLGAKHTSNQDCCLIQKKGRGVMGCYVLAVYMTISFALPSTSVAWIEKNKQEIINQMGVKRLYAGFEACFVWDPQLQRCWDPIAKNISNPDVAPLWKINWGGGAFEIDWP